MKTTWKILAGIVTLSIGCLALAQGRGPGPAWAGWCWQADAGLTNGWWTQVKPADSKQRKFVDQAAKLQERILAARQALFQLQADNAADKTIAAKQKELIELCGQMRDLQLKNWDLKRQILESTGPIWGPGCAGCGNFCRLAR